MMRRFLNWRSLIFLLAMLIVAGTMYYARYLAAKIEQEERQRVAEWVGANTALQQATDPYSINLANLILLNNEDMPLIATDSSGAIVDYRNIDTTLIRQNPQYLQKVLQQISDENPPLEWNVGPFTYKVFHGDTLLQREVKYYPVVQLLLVALFTILLIALLNTRYRSTQNQVWAGMAKETAHQLGTPLTSLQGWIEVIKEQPADHNIVAEMEKDINRLKLVSERFGKIGSTPQLEPCNLAELIEHIVIYMKRRASGKVIFTTNTANTDTTVLASPTLLEWVLENLLKNALDAMNDRGSISITLTEEVTRVVVDVADTGKGMTKTQQDKVFKPGFTTKKRGWGLGLTLSRRIVEKYHRGQLFVKHSEPGKGTTFRIILPR